MTPAAEIARLRELLAAGALPAVVRTVHTPVFSLAFDAADCVVFRVTVEGQGEEARQVASDSCRASAEARNALPALLDDLEAARGALQEIADLEPDCCRRCEGNGNVYADGKSHYMSEGAATIACPNCGGAGHLTDPDAAKDIAAAYLAPQEPDHEDPQTQA